MKSAAPRRRSDGLFWQPSRQGRRLVLALVASVLLHLLVSIPIFVPIDLFAARREPPPELVPVQVVTLPPAPTPQAEPEPPKPMPEPEPQPQTVELPPATPPPPVTPQQIVVATRAESTPPQGDERDTAADKAEPTETDKPMPTPEQAEPAKPEPPKPAPEKPEPPKAEPAKPEPPKPTIARPEPRKPPEPEPEVTGAIALARPPTRPRDQITDADHKMPPVVVRPKPPGRAGNSLMPSYPSAARANGLQGRVVLLAVISPDGRPRRIDIARSSGYDQLDESAVRAVWLWRFYRTDNGPPMEATIEIPLDFKL